MTKNTKQLTPKISITLKTIEQPKNLFQVAFELDTNDGDYIYSTSVLTVEEFIEAYPLLEAVNDGTLSGIGEYCSDRSSYIIPEELEDIAYDLFPRGEYGGHNLDITSLQYFDADGILFDVQL